MIFYTSDLHLGHRQVIEACDRPFESVAEMNDTLIKNWNKIVKDDDDVYIIGDLIYKDEELAKEIIPQLNGKKHLITGNNDLKWLNEETTGYFEEVCNYLEITDDSHKVILFHYPLLQWNGIRRGSIHIYGHVHNNKKDSDYAVLAKKKRALNAGTDINNFKPVKLKQLIANNDKFYNRVTKEVEKMI